MYHLSPNGLNAAMGSTQGCCSTQAQVPPEHVQAPVNEAETAVGASYSAQLGPVESGAEMQDSMPTIQDRRLTKALEVDLEILRGMPLHRALRRPQIWIQPRLYRHTHRSAQLWLASLPTSSLDIFLSHSWRTPGSQKILGLLLQEGWLHALLGWFLLTGLFLYLRLQCILDAPLKRTLLVAGVRYECDSTYWLVIAGAVGLLGGFFLSLYFPLKSRLCFLDIACVHQGDQELLLRGISNIGGCLAVSRELQVLYHPTYFTSHPARFRIVSVLSWAIWEVPYFWDPGLWCMFELAAFRKAHPTRPISLLPLFLLGLVAVATVWLWVVCIGVFVLVHVVSTTTDSGSRTTAWVGILGAFLFLPLIGLVHTSRLKYREKHQLLMDLRQFHLESLSCETDFDREFILNAVDEWYGSRNSFAALVRGPLCEELLSMLPTPHLPLSYAAPMISSVASLYVEQVAGLHLAGAEGPTTFIYILSFSSFLLSGIHLGFNLVFYLGDRLAAPGSRVPDFTKTLAGAGLVLAWILASFGLASGALRGGTIGYSLTCFVLHVILMLWVFRPSPYNSGKHL